MRLEICDVLFDCFVVLTQLENRIGLDADNLRFVCI